MKTKIQKHRNLNALKSGLKKGILLCSLLLLSVFASAQTEIDTHWKNQINPIFQGLNKNRVPHKVLLDYAMEFTNVPAYNGTLTDSTYVDATILGNIYKTLFMAKVSTSTQHFPKLETIASNWVTQRRNHNQNSKNTLVLAGLYYKYAALNPTALSTNKIRVYNNKYYDKYKNGVWQNPYLTKQTIAFALPVHNYNKLNFGVVLPQNMLLSNSGSAIQSIQVNFSDGGGYKTLALNQKVYANYAQNGTYNWTFKTTLSNGTILYSRTKIKVVTAETPTPNPPTQNSSNAYENNIVIPGPNSSLPIWSNGAVLRIDYAPAHNGLLKKPFIVAEGFDTGSILKPEVEGGDRTLNDFLNANNSLPSSGELRNLLLFDSTQEYDIVYIDWQNGTNSLQHNSGVLKNVLAWVNAKKASNGSTEPNVLLGQSMGGVIGKYTLAKMEAAGESHDVRLFVAHDAPMQGANTPLSLQYFTRHAYDQYTSAPTLYGLVEVVIPTVLNLVELMSLGNLDIAFPSAEDYLTLQDTPAALQMNYHYVDRLSQPTTAIHDTWQTEFESVGYPTQSRNVAISNGNECAVDHGYDPRAKFLNLHDTHDPDFWGDLVHYLATPLAGVLTSDLELVFLGLLPGESVYYYDFDLYANPDVNQSNRKVYFGRLKYEKKLFWIAPITHTITNRNKYAPNGYLPFDTYSGGYVDYVSAAQELFDRLPSSAIVNSRYGFIPVVSALDIKRNNGEVIPNDYLKKYAGGTTPEAALTSDFDNFIVDFTKNNPINNAHISFQKRNGDWLANELEEDDNLIEDCSAFCSNAGITGNSRLCNSSTYSVTSEATWVNWWVSQGAGAVTTSTNGNQITLTLNNPFANTTVVLNASYGNTKCGYTTVSKTIISGRPSYPNTAMTGDDYVYPGQYKNYYVPPATGATSYHWYFDYGAITSDDGSPSGAWEIKSGQGSRSIYVKIGDINSSVVVVCKASNSCGKAIKYMYVTVGSTGGGGGGGGGGDCDELLRLSSNPLSSKHATHKIIWVEDPCDDDNGLRKAGKSLKARKYTIEIFNMYREKVYSRTQNSPSFDLTRLNSGFYFVKYKTKLGNVLTKKILVK